MSSETEAGGDADRSADGGYVHAPEGDPSSGGPVSGGPDEPDADGFGTRGWALTAVLFTCVLVIPGVIYLYPYAAGAFGFTFFATYLALPLVPALLLGLVAVWSMTAATRDQ
ncbi:hypothetical protein C461_07309 [Halorubrum aidingense JCM 13560]|uniref:Uncharacterized protein n=1 Tax=Halorubrum aidingense JCM 13560 TaxID=1230454 RepID=M0PBY5_9EURY|nr:hypothetical protein [Halorubrum aidingense]EMA67516.1 hypothetical protein C461_07309 [Halorubrum aidingense JCM 13560]